MTSGISSSGPNPPIFRSPLQDLTHPPLENLISEIAHSALTPATSPSEQIKLEITSSKRNEPSSQEKALTHLTEWLEQGNQPPLSKEEMELLCPYLLQILNLPYCLPALDNDVLERFQKANEDFQVSSSKKRAFPLGKLEKILTLSLQQIQVKEVLSLDEIARKKIKETEMVQEEDEMFPIVLELVKLSPIPDASTLINTLKAMDEGEKEKILPIVRELLKLDPNTVAVYLIDVLKNLEEERRNEILPIALELLKAAPNSGADHLIKKLDELDAREMEEILPIVHELLKLAPNTVAVYLIDALKNLEKRRRNEILPTARELLKAAPDSGAGHLIKKLNEIDAAKLKEILPYVRNLLKLAPTSNAGILIEALKAIDERKRNEILPIACELLKAAPNSSAGSLIRKLNEIDGAKKQEILPLVHKLLKVAPNSDAGDLMEELSRIDERKRGEILTIVHELLKLAPNSDAGDLMEALRMEALSRIDERKRGEILTIVHELLKLAPNSDAGDLMEALSRIDERKRGEILTIVHELLKLAPGADAMHLIYDLSTEKGEEKIGVILLELLKALPEVETSVLIDLFVKTFAEQEQESIRGLIFKLIEAHPKASISSIFSVIHNTFGKEKEEMCSFALRLLEVAPHSNASYLVAMLKRVLHATESDKEEWGTIYSRTLKWLKTDPTSSAGHLLSLMGDIPKNESNRFDDFLYQLREIFPESSVGDLLYSLYTLTPEERKELTVLLFEELPQLSEQPLSFKDVDATLFVTLFKKAPAASLFLLQTLKNQPDLEVKAFVNQVSAFPQTEQTAICAFIKSHLKRNPTADVFAVLKVCKEIREGNSKLDMSAIKDFLPLLTPEQVREVVQAATEEEVNEALATPIYLRLANEYLSVEEALKMGIEQGIEVIEEGRKRGVDDAEGIRLITHFLDEFHPFTLSVAAKAFPQLISRYHPFMQVRHEAVVFPNNPTKQ